MNNLSTVQTEFTNLCKIALDSEWWRKLSPEEQRQYILQHRKTKLRPHSRPTSIARSIMTKVPKQWREKLISESVSENSEFIQLSDKVRPREIKSVFDDSGVKAIVAFVKPDLTTNEPYTAIRLARPAFLITKSYQEDKFRAVALTPDKQDQDIVKKKERYRYRRGRYGNSGPGSWTERVHDLRISAITESLPDVPYVIYALKADEERQKARQERSSLRDGSNRRDIEKKLIADIAKPIYDYYDENLQTYTKQLQQSAMPSFDKIMQGKHEGIDSTIVDKIKEANGQIGRLASMIDSFKYHSLPRPDKSYSEDRYDRESFMRRVKEFKESFAKQYNLACQRRVKYITDSIKKNDFADAISQLGLIKQKDLARELSQIVQKQSINANEIDEVLIKLSGVKEQLRDKFSELEQRTR